MNEVVGQRLWAGQARGERRRERREGEGGEEGGGNWRGRGGGSGSAATAQSPRSHRLKPVDTKPVQPNFRTTNTTIS